MISLKKIVKAQTAIAPYIQTTSLVRVDYLSELTQMNVFLKLENMQYTGSFKLRGAMNKIAQLTPEEKAKGVVAASALSVAQAPGGRCSPPSHPARGIRCDPDRARDRSPH